MGLTRTLMVAGTGAALAYLLDPISGKERRDRLRGYWQERMQAEPGLADVLDTSPAVVVPQQPVVRPSAE